MQIQKPKRKNNNKSGGFFTKFFSNNQGKKEREEKEKEKASLQNELNTGNIVDNSRVMALFEISLKDRKKNDKDIKILKEQYLEILSKCDLDSLKYFKMELRNMQIDNDMIDIMICQASIFINFIDTNKEILSKKEMISDDKLKMLFTSMIEGGLGSYNDFTSNLAKALEGGEGFKTIIKELKSINGGEIGYNISNLLSLYCSNWCESDQSLKNYNIQGDKRYEVIEKRLELRALNPDGNPYLKGMIDKQCENIKNFIDINLEKLNEDNMLEEQDITLILSIFSDYKDGQSVYQGLDGRELYQEFKKSMMTSYADATKFLDYLNKISTSSLLNYRGDLHQKAIEILRKHIDCYYKYQVYNSREGQDKSIYDLINLDLNLMNQGDSISISHIGLLLKALKIKSMYNDNVGFFYITPPKQQEQQEQPELTYSQLIKEIGEQSTKETVEYVPEEQFINDYNEIIKCTDLQSAFYNFNQLYEQLPKDSLLFKSSYKILLYHFYKKCILTKLSKDKSDPNYAFNPFIIGNIFKIFEGDNSNNLTEEFLEIYEQPDWKQIATPYKTILSKMKNKSLYKEVCDHMLEYLYQYCVKEIENDLNDSEDEDLSKDDLIRDLLNVISLRYNLEVDSLSNEYKSIPKTVEFYDKAMTFLSKIPKEQDVNVIYNIIHKSLFNNKTPAASSAEERPSVLGNLIVPKNAKFISLEDKTFKGELHPVDKDKETTLHEVLYNYFNELVIQPIKDAKTGMQDQYLNLKKKKQNVRNLRYERFKSVFNEELSDDTIQNLVNWLNEESRGKTINLLDKTLENDIKDLAEIAEKLNYQTKMLSPDDFEQKNDSIDKTLKEIEEKIKEIENKLPSGKYLAKFIKCVYINNINSNDFVNYKQNDLFNNNNKFINAGTENLYAKPFYSILNRDIEKGAKDKKNMLLNSLMKATEPLFPHKPCIDDVKQGDMNNRYLLLAIKSLINSPKYGPNFIMDMMRDNQDGTVTVRLYTATYSDKPGESDFDKYGNIKSLHEEFVRVYKHGIIYSPDCALWVNILEQAYAVIGGNLLLKKSKLIKDDYFDEKDFANIDKEPRKIGDNNIGEFNDNTLWPMYVFMTLTGKVAYYYHYSGGLQTMNSKEINFDKKYKYITNAIDKKLPVIVKFSTNYSILNEKIDTYKTYSVLDYRYEGDNESLYLTLNGNEKLEVAFAEILAGNEEVEVPCPGAIDYFIIPEEV